VTDFRRFPGAQRPLLLRKVPEVFHTQITQVLLGAFARALGRLGGSGVAFLAMARRRIAQRVL